MTVRHFSTAWFAAFGLIAACASDKPGVGSDVSADAVDASIETADTASQQEAVETSVAEDTSEVLGPDSGVDDTSAGETAETITPLPEIAWVREGAIEVGVVNVPYNYAAPDGPRFDLRVARVKHTGPIREGVILWNFGGPGGEGVPMLEFVADYFSGPLTSYDFVTWNPRGTDGSDELGCTDDATAWEAILDAYDGSLEASSVEALLETMRDFIDSCRSSNPDLIDHMGYMSWTDDMESIRIALGVEQLSYFGASAGTALGAVYAQRYPERVGRFVLDSNVSPHGGLQALLMGQAGAADALVKEWADWCSGSASCAVRADPMGILQAVTRRSMNKPLDVDGTSLTYARMAFGAFWSLYSSESWAALARDLADANAEDGSALLQGARDYMGNTESGGFAPEAAVAYLTGCSDGIWYPTAEEIADRTLAEEAASGTAGGLSRLLWLDNLWCTALGPVPNAVSPLQGVDAPPMLMLQARFDVATPLASALTLQAELDNGSPMAIWEGASHGASFYSDCLKDYADAFFMTGVLPDDGAICED